MKTNNCKRCGSKLTPGSTFCNVCGSPTEQQTAPTLKPPQKSRLLLTWVFVIGALLLGVVLFLILYSPSAPVNGGLQLGRTVSFGIGVVPTTGGEIIIEDSGTPIDGMKISLQEGTYTADTVFEISLTDISSHSMGALFNPITPLITIENGGEFAESPMFLTIPIDIEDDEFAMGFFYNRETGALEGIPLVYETNDTAVLMTSHFCDIVMSKVKKTGILDTPTETGFSVKTDNFQMPNHGSYREVNGHCAGQSIASIYYYMYIKEGGELRGGGIPLYGRFDNDANIVGSNTTDADITPALWQDDSEAIRLCTAVDVEFEKVYQEKKFLYYDGITRKDKYFYYENYAGFDDQLTYCAFAYAMKLTKMPQLMTVFRDGGGHALVAYRIEDNRIYVADPNKPEGTDRFVELEIKNNGSYQFKLYGSGENADEIEDGERFYNKIGYMGVFAIIDKTAVQKSWVELLEGSGVGKSLFPSDVGFSVTVGKDSATGEWLEKELKDGLSISAQEWNEGGYDRFMIYPNQGEMQTGDRFTVYQGGQELKSIETKGSFVAYPIQTGLNDIGILHERIATTRNGKQVYRFVQFYRFKVTVEKTAVSLISLAIEPEYTELTAGQQMELVAAVSGETPNPLYTWDFGDGNMQQTEQGHVLHVYEIPGEYQGVVMLSDSADPDMALGSAEFSVVVFETPTSTAVQPPETTWEDSDFSSDLTPILGKWVYVYSAAGSTGSTDPDSLAFSQAQTDFIGDCDDYFIFYDTGIAMVQKGMWDDEYEYSLWPGGNLGLYEISWENIEPPIPLFLGMYGIYAPDTSYAEYFIGHDGRLYIPVEVQEDLTYYMVFERIK